MVLLSLLGDLNVTLFEFYSIMFTDFFQMFEYLLKEYSSQVTATCLVMETWSLREEIRALHLFVFLTKSFCTSFVGSAYTVTGSSPRGANLMFHLCFLLPTPTRFSFIPCSHHFNLPFQEHPVCFQDSLSSAWNASAFPFWPRIHIPLSWVSWSPPCLTFKSQWISPAFPRSLPRSYSPN